MDGFDPRGVEDRVDPQAGGESQSHSTGLMSLTMGKGLMNLGWSLREENWTGMSRVDSQTLCPVV